MKYLLIVALAVLSFIAVWVYIGSIDADVYDDRGMEAEYQSFLAKKANSDGMKHMPFLRDRHFSILNNGRDRYALKTYLSNLRWDKSRVEVYRTLGHDRLPAVMKSLEADYYLISELNYADLRQAFPLSGAEDLFLLLLLESQWQFHEERSVDQAYLYLSAAMKMNVRMAELVEEGFLGVNIASQYRALSYPWFSFLSQRLSQAQLGELKGRLVQWNSRYEEALKLAYIGEFMVGKRYMESGLMQQSVLSRPKFPKEGGPGLRSVSWSEKRLYLWDFFYQLLSSDYADNDSMRSFLMDYFPRYFYHKNRNLHRNAAYFSKRRDSVLSLCKDKRVSNEKSLEELNGARDKQKSIPWYVNDIGRYEQAELPKETMEQYQHDECLYRQWSQVFLARLGIAEYLHENKELPDTLAQLHPGFLAELPRDRFNGEGLGYSKEKAWLYSSGADFLNDGGSADALVSNTGRCSRLPCKNKPTYPLYIQPPFPLWPGPDSTEREYRWEAHGKL
ncbi:hypothetical protein NBRC116587_32040 [Pseudoteredinibacter isoporae]